MFIEFRGYKILFLDIEASSLHQNSYPIEVGWVLDDEQEPYTFLIRPHSTWNRLEGWSLQSETIHSISLTTLDKDGISVEEACQRLDRAVEGCILVSDNPEHDSRWLNRLAKAAGRSRGWAAGQVE